MVLNTIVAESFREIADELEKADNFEMACHDMIKKLFTNHHRIVFNGNGYSDDWIAEAERRGLPNITSMVDAIPALITDKAIKLFESFGVFTKAELESRVEIQYEGYSKAINIEAKTMIDVAGKQIIPAVISYSTELANSVLAVSNAGADASTQKALLNEVSALLKEMKSALTKLIDVTAAAGEITGAGEQAKYYRDTVKSAMAQLRAPADKLEMMVDKKFWPFPSYGDLMFEV